jgi:hypothetical protein
MIGCLCTGFPPQGESKFASFLTSLSLKDLCYTFVMQMPRPEWSDWADQLRRLKLDTIVAWMLEAGAPVTLLGAQALFIARPLLGAGSEAFAHLLEEDDEVHAFAAYLRGGVVS